MSNAIELTKENKIKCFEVELEEFRNPYIRTFTMACIAEMPDYFFLKPSTSTGKYHPADERGHYGLVLHTKRVFSILQALFRMDEYSSISETNKEYLMAAALLHDCMKYGDPEHPSTHTVFEHPMLAGKFVIEIAKKHDYTPSAEIIAHYIYSHSGQWCTSPYSLVVLPKPTTIEEKVLHLADYMASKIPNITIDDVPQFIIL